MVFRPQDAEIFHGGPEQYWPGHGDHDEVVFTPPTTEPDVVFDDAQGKLTVWSLAENIQSHPAE